MHRDRTCKEYLQRLPAPIEVPLQGFLAVHRCMFSRSVTYNCVKPFAKVINNAITCVQLITQHSIDMELPGMPGHHMHARYGPHYGSLHIIFVTEHAHQPAHNQ